MEKIAPPPPSLNPKISPEDRLLFICARQRPAPEHRRMALALRQNHPLNWEAIFTTASRHGVAPLIYAAIRHIGPDALAVPDAVTAEFKRAYYSNIIRKERRAERLARGLAFFNERGIEVMLIKGGALDVLVYDRPWYTVPHDIDLVLKLKPEELPPATEAEIRHFFHKTGIEFDYFAHHDVTMNGVLPVDFGQIWDRAVKITLHGQPVWVMAPEDMLLAACINGCRKRFFRLKSLCDTAEIINKYPGLNWDRFI
ncbi:MAG: nucleotidyltransferase family protein, partial [Anaerolineae bacterium]